jgi:CDP-diacylglycerol--glycerol-3-phosphate 3-phosphatidyltransferase
MLTVVGVSGNLVAAVLCALGEFWVAGIVMLFFSSIDFLDGSLARATEQATDFGSVFDAVMDRVSEAAVLFGLLVWFSDKGDQTNELLIFVAVAGSMLVSYVRARSEIIGVQLREGLFTREVRVAVLGIALIIGGLIDDTDVITWALWALAVLTVLTAAQRLWLVWRATRVNH